jgi:hypothetical protein
MSNTKKKQKNHVRETFVMRLTSSSSPKPSSVGRAMVVESKK